MTDTEALELFLNYELASPYDIFDQFIALRNARQYMFRAQDLTE